ncbi:serine--tRNA ligase, partial [Paenibacillus sepulcri]|nr:serine--tRNA ligase [Paenibacillus sepulcri]
MLDVKLLRNDFSKVELALKKRGKSAELISEFPILDTKWRDLLQESEQLKSRRNTVSQEVAKLKKSGGDAEALIVEMREVGDRIKVLDEEVRVVEAEIAELTLAIPNIPHESVPVGSSEADNVEIRRVGEVTELQFEPKAHWELAQELGILDFEA